MKPSSRLTLLTTMTGLLLLAAAAGAQVDGVQTFAETTCGGNEVEIQITLNVYDVITPGITGWVVEREVLGTCVEMVDVGGIRPMPTEIGEHDFIVQDVPEVPGKQIYYVRAVDDEGSRYWISWPRRTHFAQADCFAAPAARGTVVLVPGIGHYLEVCPDECWWGLSYFDPIFPPNQELPIVGSVVNIFGEIISGLEGPYIDAFLWIYSPGGCMGVANEDLQWGSLKALYR